MAEFFDGLKTQHILVIGLGIIILVVIINIIIKYFALCRCVMRLEIAQARTETAMKQIAEQSEKSIAKLNEISQKIGREERII